MKQFCPKGHDTFIVGRDKDSYCRKCARESFHTWTKNNPEKDREDNRKYREDNPEKVKESFRNWAKTNTEKDKESCHSWVVNNREKDRISCNSWTKANPSRIKAIVKKCDLKRLQRVLNYGQTGIVEFYAHCPDGYVVDHIIPLNGKIASGLHILSNLQYLTSHENYIKSNKFDGTLENNSWRKDLW